MTRCAYCGHSIKLAEPSPARPVYTHQHAPAPAPAQPRPSRTLLLIVVMIVTFFLSVAAIAFFAWIGASEPAATRNAPPAAAVATSHVASPSPAPTPAPPVAAKPTPAGYPLRSLLGINVAVDIDGSSAHMKSLFPDVESNRVADQLRFAVPLEHPWFGHVELSWKNERAGKLVTVGFKPPLASDKLANPKQIADCLGTGLGKPEAREVDHLSGEMSYFFGKGFPKAWANVYSGYVWLAFEDPRGVPPVTFAQVVRTLERCTP
jgi:hypothetical protein